MRDSSHEIPNAAIEATILHPRIADLHVSTNAMAPSRPCDSPCHLLRADLRVYGCNAPFLSHRQTRIIVSASNLYSLGGFRLTVRASRRRQPLTNRIRENRQPKYRTKDLAHPRAHRGTVASHRPNEEKGMNRTPLPLSRRQPCTVDRKAPSLAHPRAHRGTVASYRPNVEEGMNRTLHQLSS